MGNEKRYDTLSEKGRKVAVVGSGLEEGAAPVAEKALLVSALSGDIHTTRVGGRTARTHLVLLHLAFYVARQREESLVDVQIGLGGRLKELCSVLDGQLFSAVSGHFPSLLDVAFVSDDHSLDIRGGVLFNITDPILDVLE